MEFLVRTFPVVPLDPITGPRADGHPAQGPVAFTFDDGLRQQLHGRLLDQTPTRFAGDALRRPGLVADGRWLWTHEARARLARLSPAAIREGLESSGAEGLGIDSGVEWTKTIPLVMRLHAEEAIREATLGFTPSAAEHERFDVMAAGARWWIRTPVERFEGLVLGGVSLPAPLT